MTLPVGFPAGPTPLPSAMPSTPAGARATSNVIDFVFNIYGVPSATLISASARAALSSALAAAIMIGPNLVANGGGSSGGESTGRAFDMVTLVNSPLAPTTLTITSSGGSSVLYPTSRRLSVAEDEHASLRALQAGVPIEWHAQVAFTSPSVAYQVGVQLNSEAATPSPRHVSANAVRPLNTIRILAANTIQWATTLATQLMTQDAADFPPGKVVTSLAQPILYP
jgi:hypothetical protein